jgi:hypothetical protein
MENRREDRVPVEQPIVLAILGDPEIRLAAKVKNVSLRGLGVLSEQPAPPGACVKIEFGDSIFLGEISYCSQTEQGYFSGVRLTQVLSGLAALSKMAEAFERELHPVAR